MNEKNVVPIPPDKRLAKRFRIIGFTLFLLGLVGAALVFALGKPPVPDIPDNLATLQMQKKNAQAEQMLFGKSAGTVNGLRDDLAQPGVQAVIIVLAAGLLAWGCFHIAKLSDE